MIRLASAALMALFLFPAAAFAATDTTVDISGLLSPILELVLTACVAVGLWLGRKAIDAVQERTGLEFDEQMKNRVDLALFRALHYGKNKAEGVLKNRAIPVDVRSTVIAHAIEYAQDAIPATLKYFEIDQARLTNMLEARLGMDIDGDGDVGEGAA